METHWEELKASAKGHSECAMSHQLSLDNCLRQDFLEVSANRCEFEVFWYD